MQLVIATLAAAFIGVLLYFLGYRVLPDIPAHLGVLSGLWFGLEVVRLVLGKGFLATGAGLMRICPRYRCSSFILPNIRNRRGIGGHSVWRYPGFWRSRGAARNTRWNPGAYCRIGCWGHLRLIHHQAQPADLIMAVTALAGANLIVFALLSLLNKASLEALKQTGNSIQVIHQASPLWSLTWLLLAVLGFLLQLRINRDFHFQKGVYFGGWG